MRIPVISAGAWFRPALVFFLISMSAELLNASASSDTLSIGLLIQDSRNKAAVNGASLAVMKTNREGGINGHPVMLAVKSMEGPWGVGSKQAVDLVFVNRVVALVCSADGRNTHLAEQVVAKAKIPLISAWSSDPTLAQAFVPWFFNMVPGDLQQAEALVGKIYSTPLPGPLTLISDTLYDSASALRNFIRVTGEKKVPEPMHLIYRGSESSRELVRQIKKAGSGAVVLFIGPSDAPALLTMIKRECPGIKIYGSVAMLDENRISAPDSAGLGSVIFSGLPGLSGKSGKQFETAYFREYGSYPGAVAAYAYDTMTILLRAIKDAGTTEESITAALMKIRADGATGLIGFDERGSRKGLPAVGKIKISSPGPAK